MQAYSEVFDQPHNMLRVLPMPVKGAFNWTEITDHIRAKIAEGIINIELDLARMQFIDSLTLGLIVGYNMATHTAGGSFRLLVNRQSPIHKVIQQMKLHLIVSIIETNR